MSNETKRWICEECEKPCVVEAGTDCKFKYCPLDTTACNWLPVPAAQPEPCPFCGGVGQMNYIGGCRQVSCDTCFATGTLCATEAEAIAAWNRREGSGS
jgi:hypothetical protein